MTRCGQLNGSSFSSQGGLLGLAAISRSTSSSIALKCGGKLGMHLEFSSIAIWSFASLFALDSASISVLRLAVRVEV